MRNLFLFLLLLAAGSTLSAQRAIRPDENINSRCEEREPIPSPDGNTLYFWRRECPENTAGYNDRGDIWYSERLPDGTWSEASRFGSPLNSKGHDFVWQVSSGHDTLFVMQAAPGVQEAGIGYSIRTGSRGNWANPEPMHIRNFQYDGNYKDYFRGAGNVLLLPNEGYPSYGGTDLYVCFPNNDTSWSKPMNLGPVINSSGNEDAPFLAPDGKTLYFNSDGRTNRGDHDIYISIRLDDSWQNWTQPRPLPAPVNSRGYDFDFQLSADGNTAWWCSDLGTLGNNDIFYIDLSTCEVDIYPGGDLTYCRGEEVRLEAGFSADIHAEYQWYKNGSPVPGGFGASLVVTDGGNYHVVRKSQGCEAISEVRPVTFVAPPRPLIEAGGDVICLEDSILLQVTDRFPNARYQWKINGLEIPDANGSGHWIESPGTYQVEVAYGNCRGTSPGYEVRTFNPPIVFTEDDTLAGWMPILPQWQWTNKIPVEKGDAYIRDLATGPRGEIYVMSERSHRNNTTRTISSFFPNGLERGILDETSISSLSRGFLATDPDGNLIVSTEEEYLRKYKSDGRVMWWKPVSYPGIMGLCTDPLGNIYTAGRFRDTISIGHERLNAPDRGAIFLAKHSPRGELLWVRSWAVDDVGFDFGNALSSDCEGNVYLAGGFDLVADFGRFPIRGTLLKDNYFLVKINPDGQVLFSRKIITERTRVKSGDIDVQCDGRVNLLLNRQYHLYASNGIDLWSGDLLMPEGTYALSHRMTSFQGDVYSAGFTLDGRFFVSKLNRLFNQVILWEDRGASTTEADLPAIGVDQRGGVIVSGHSRGNGYQGDQFDLTSGSPLFVMKYDRPMVEVIEREPLSLCGNEPVVLLVREEPGLQYQWIRNGRPISGAVQTAFRATREGTYQVMAFVSGCERISDPVVVSECGDEPQIAETYTQPSPEPEVALETDLDYGLGGTPSRLKGRRVRSQEEVNLQRTEASIFVWDHGAVDQDTVSINLNGQWILENYALRKEALQIPVSLQPGDNYLMLYAHNLGSTPPNTASVKVDDGILTRTIQLRSSLRNCGMLRIRVE